MDLLGLNKLPPEMQAVLSSIAQQIEKRVDDQLKSGLDRVDQIVESALDRIDGAQIVTVCTVKLPEKDSKIAEPAGS